MLLMKEIQASNYLIAQIQEYQFLKVLLSRSENFLFKFFLLFNKIPCENGLALSSIFLCN